MLEKLAGLGSIKSRLKRISPERDPRRKRSVYVWKHSNTAWAHPAALLALAELSASLSANLAEGSTTSALEMCVPLLSILSDCLRDT